MRVVQKYGGTSVADAERIRHVAGRVVERVRQGDEVVVVEVVALLLLLKPLPHLGKETLDVRGEL